MARSPKAPVEPWRIRIVGEGEEDPEQLLANPLNFRIHPKAQQDALAAVLNEVGWVGRILVNRPNKTVIDGHLRASLAISRGERRVPVQYTDLNPAEEAKVLATLDPIAAMAGADKAVLEQLLGEVSTGDAALQAMLDNLAVKEGITPPPDPFTEWDGMPEFAHEDKTAFQSVVVHFKDQAAVDAFAELTGQKLTPNTRSLWYPQIEIESYADKRYAPES